MSCAYSPEQLYLYLDGELAPTEAHEVARHLSTCTACQQAVATHQRLQVLLRRALEEEDVPAQLWPTIRQRLARDVLLAGPAARGLTRRGVWIGCGAAAVLLLLGWLSRRRLMPSPPAVVQEMVESHIRTRLMAAPYTQLPADPKAIRAWFRDKVEFAVPVPQLPPSRYALLGVRLNYFLSRRVAEVAYATNAHVLSFFMLAEPERALHMVPTPVSVHRQKGYTAVLWQDGGLVCGLVSDLPATVLLALLQQAFPGRTTS